MRKRIEELAEGKIPYEQPQIVFSKEKLELEVVEGQAVSDSFQMKSENGIWMRGIIYTSSTRMECLTPQFEGEEADIRVQFHARGLAEGEISSGELYIICSGGEYQLSYAVTVTRLYAEASTGKIKNLRDFTKLGKAEWKEAYHIFHSPAFKNILSPKDLKASLLYEGLSSPTITEQAMEEFLIGTGRKERVHFSLETADIRLLGLTGPAEEQVMLHKDGWGFLEIWISSDSGFLIPQKQYLTDADFMGTGCPFAFYIDTEKMHAGNNYGRLLFENGVQRETVCVWACAGDAGEKKERDYWKFQHVQLQLARTYIDYRLKKIITGSWTKQTLALIRQIEDLKLADEWHMLFKAYALLHNKQKQDAEWLLNEFRQKFKDKKKPQWAFYDYLCLQKEKEPVVIERLLAEIEETAGRLASHPVMFFLTLRLSSVLRAQPQARLLAIEERVLQGQYSPLWYLEAFFVYEKQPYLLTKLEQFEILVMNWAVRQGVMTRDLAEQLMRLANNMRQFQSVVCRILFCCYAQFPDEDMLAGVCAYLMKGQCYQQKYHPWYAKGIEENLKITGLYEAYLLTMDLHGIQTLPKVIQMYFQYNNQLAYQYKAALYVSIIAHKEEQPAIYGKYSETMKQFALDEILKGHIDDNLAVIYEEMLDKGILTQEIAASLADILYTHKFYCTNPAAAFVVVVQKHMKNEQRVPITGECAYFQLFSNDYAILLEDNKGQRFVSPESCQLEKLMKPSHYIRRCLKLAPEKLQYLMHHMDGKADLKLPEKTDVEYLRILMDSPLISAKFKNQIGPGLVRYCLLNESREHLEEYLVQIDFGSMRREGRSVLTELMIEHGLYEKAYELINSFGYDSVDKQLLADLASYMIRERDIGEDAFFVEMCMAALLADAYNASTASYLAVYYEGPSKLMMLVYKAALACNVRETAELAERLLVQTLYSTEYVHEIHEVYQSYRALGGKELVLQAYRSYYMHEYVVNGMVLPENLFVEACRLQKEGKLRGAACRLGLLKYFSECAHLDHYQMKEADELLNEFVSRNMNFAFFKNLPESLCSRYQLNQRYLVEYHARPDSRIQIHYRMPEVQDTFIMENMPNVYDGIFTWEFLLFRDDELEYYITEEENGIQRLGESRRVPGIAYRDISRGGRYAYINHMLYLRGQDDYRELMRVMQEYEKLDHLTSRLFKVI